MILQPSISFCTDQDVEEDMKKEVVNVMEQSKLATQWCAPPNFSEDQGPQYIHCMEKIISEREASFLNSL
jgi:hypothetical protein